MKVEKRIVIFPQKYKAVTLSVTDADSFEDADEILRKEVSKYAELLDDEDLDILYRTIGLVK